MKRDRISQNSFLLPCLEFSHIAIAMSCTSSSSGSIQVVPSQAILWRDELGDSTRPCHSSVSY